MEQTAVDIRIGPKVIQIYLDESTDKVSYAIAGFIGAEENWDGFAGNWNAAMQKHGLKAIALHMKEVTGSPYEPWASLRADPARLNALLEDLVDVIIAHKLTAFGAVLFMAEYMALGAEAKKRWPNPYKLCFETAMNAADATCNPAPGGKIYMTFDQGCNEGWARQAYRKLEAKAASKAFADEALFDDDRLRPELVAADYLAFELRRAFYNYYVQKKNDLRPAFQKLTLKTPYVFWKVQFQNVIEGDKVIEFAGTKDAVAEIFIYQDDPKP